MNTCLTIVLPKALEEELLDELLAHPEWSSGFTSSAASGHGHGLSYRSAGEQVRGRVARVQVQIVTAQEHAQALLAHLKQCLPTAEITYWLTAVLEFGRFE